VIRAAEPIDPAGARYRDGDGRPVGSDDHEAVRQLTDEIRDRLASVSPDFDSLLEAVELRAAADLLLRSSGEVAPLSETSLAEREALAADLDDLPDDRQDEVGARVAEYRLLLDAVGVRDEHLVPSVGVRALVRQTVVTALLVLVLAPFALMGVVVNLVPALLVFLAGLAATAPVSKGTNRVLAGVVAFPVAWGLLAVEDVGSGWASSAIGATTSPLSPLIRVAFGDRGGWGPSLVVFVAAPAFGLLAVWLLEQVERSYRTAIAVWTATKRRGQLRELLEHRASTLEAIERASGAAVGRGEVVGPAPD
jgi:hypothetical protein